MFRHSGPGHMLLHTVQKPKVQGWISLSLALSLVRVKVKFTQTEVYKDHLMEKIDPLRGDPAPSPTVPLLHCPHGPSMPRFFSLSADSSPPPIARAGQAPHTWGRLAALLVLKMVMVGKGTRTLLDVDVAWWQRLWWWRPSLHRQAGLKRFRGSEERW